MPRLKQIRLPVSANLKLILVVLAFAIVAVTLVYTQGLVENLKQTERRTVQLYAQMLHHALNSTGQDGGSFDISYELAQSVEFPIIMADHDGTPKVSWYTGDTTLVEFTRNIPLDTTLPAWQQKAQLQELIHEMGRGYEPLTIMQANPGGDSTINTLIYYDDGAMIQQLRLVPFIGIIIIAMFVLVGYLSFSHIKRNEQSNIWVGMAKETAHQLGTPLSSLLGWIELLRYMPEDPAQVLEAAGEMERDVFRLNTIAQRFSKIGSPAEVHPVDMREVLSGVVTYFERRLPHLGRRVTLSLDAPEPVWAAVNVDLFAWVFENLVRNAADAIDHVEGTIKLVLRRSGGSVLIDVVDNGRGIDPKVRKDIFRPGFSTKQRGWGLGLSLARRIVEEYHGGRITVKQTGPAGTTFRIRIAAVEPAERSEEREARSEESQMRKEGV